MRLPAFLLACTLCLAAEKFAPDQVKILDAIDYGQTSAPVDCPAGPSYCALLFNGMGGDKIDVNVKSPDQKAFVALADGGLTELTRGTGHLSFALPSDNKEMQTYYIVFRDADSKAGKFTVQLTKVDKQSASTVMPRTAVR